MKITTDGEMIKLFKVADIRKLMIELSNDKISVGRFTEIINERVFEAFTNRPQHMFAKMDLVNGIEAYIKTFKCSAETSDALHIAHTNIVNEVVNDCVIIHESKNGHHGKQP